MNIWCGTVNSSPGIPDPDTIDCRFISIPAESAAVAHIGGGCFIAKLVGRNVMVAAVIAFRDHGPQPIQSAGAGATHEWGQVSHRQSMMYLSSSSMRR